MGRGILLSVASETGPKTDLGIDDGRSGDIGERAVSRPSFLRGAKVEGSVLTEHGLVTTEYRRADEFQDRRNAEAGFLIEIVAEAKSIDEDVACEVLAANALRPIDGNPVFELPFEA